jgi:8-oxo-dGTP pyrophosphatase MutT (NUDIX family)
MIKKTKTHLARIAVEAEKLFQGQAIEQFAAICYRVVENEKNSVEVLLITTRDSGRWGIPKGWAIDGKEPYQVAEREAWEEAGVKGKAKKRAFGFYTYIKSLNDGSKVPSVVQVHLVEVVKMDDKFPERGQRFLRWLPPHEAAALVREPELKGLLGMTERKFSKRLIW